MAHGTQGSLKRQTKNLPIPRRCRLATLRAFIFHTKGYAMTCIALIVGSLNRPSLNRSAAEYIAAQAPTGVQIEEIAIYAVIPVQSGMTPFRQNPGICKGFKPANAKQAA